MILVRHELKQSVRSLVIWTLSISLFVVVCVFLFPSIENEMDGVGEMFASMGAFSSAFGMDRISIGSFMGFYSVECGSILGLGGALFAAITGASALSKEEQGRTAEFLLTHPIRRSRILTEKLASVLLLVLALNLAVFGLSAVSVLASEGSVPWRELSLLHLANLAMHLEVAGLCFGLSAFLRRGSTGLGLGLAVSLYFLNLISNITEKAAFLSWVTPFAFTDGADLLTEGGIDPPRLLLGAGYALAAVCAAYGKYTKKDIQ